MSVHPVASPAMEMEDSDMRGQKYTYRVGDEKSPKKAKSWSALAMGIAILLLSICLLVFIALLIYLGVKNSELESKLTAQEQRLENVVITTPGIVMENVAITTPKIVMEAAAETKEGAVNHPPSKEDLNPTLQTTYRLSPLIRPIHYKLRLRSWLPNTVFSFTNRSEFSTTGELTILIHSMMQTGNISLNAQSSIDIEQHTITIVETNSTGSELPNGRRIKLLRAGMGLIEKPELDIVEFWFDRDLQENKYYLLSMKYNGMIGDDQMGYYRSSFRDESGRVRWLAATQFEVGVCRQALPCFDEPAFKASFKITLVHPRDTKAISNTPELGQPTGQMYLDIGDEICGELNVSCNDTSGYSGGWYETTFAETPLMSSYLLAWVVAPFNQLPSTFTSDGRIEFRAWSRPEMEPYLKYANYAGPKVMEFFEKYFGIPFPLPKMDQVALPDFSAGAMENWGLITYRENLLLYDKSVNDASQKQYTAVVIAHEMSHQWFGNLVTMKWWDDLWLNEGFATYMEMIGSDYIENGTLKQDDQFVLTVHDAMELDQYASTHPLSVPVKSSADADQMFDPISYSKGGSILRMLNFTIGEDTFRKGVNQYLSDLKYQNAHHNQLWDHFSKAAEGNTRIKSWNTKPIDVKSMMNRWTLQAGFPVVTVTRDYTSGGAATINFSLDQARFLVNSTSPNNNATAYSDNGYGYKWHIPIWYQTPGSEIALTWLTPYGAEQRRAPAQNPGNDWLLINPECRGFYRVNYDVRNWELLTAAVLERPETFDVRTRAMLLSDSFKLAKIGLVPYWIPFNLTTYLANEDSEVAWRTAINTLYDMRTLLLNHKDFEVFKKYLQNLFGKAYRKYGWEGRGLNLDHGLDAMLRQSIVTYSCLNDVPECTNDARTLFRQWTDTCREDQNGTTCVPNQIPTALRKTVYCGAVRAGTSDTFNFLWGQFTNETVQVEKDRLLTGLACAREESLIAKLLSFVFDEKKLRLNEALYIIRKLAVQPGGSQRIWNFIRSNWDIIDEKLFSLGSSKVGRLIGSVTRQFNTDYNIQQFEELAQAYPEFFQKHSVVLNTVRSRLLANVQWVKEYGEPLLVTLQSFI